MTSTLLGASLVAYFAASVLYLANLHIRHRYLAAYGTGATAAGFALQTARLVLQTLHAATPFANASEAIFFLSWAIAALYLVIHLRFGLPSVGALAMPLSVIALVLVYRFPTPAGEQLANGAWLRVHVVAIIASLALFVLAFCAAVFYLVQNKLLKSKNLHGMFRKLPPLEMVDSLGYHLAAIGFPLLTLGIVTGVVGVQLANLREHDAEFRLLASGVTWVVYAAYLLARAATGWRGKRAAWVLIAGAALVVVTTALHRFV
ncbi:MAG: cytochrome c biogenesis protein CcsA [Armatimonadetes bacterium]|nr:cytochrome c biogenesis protein CcsA [Armatimonadota bacterium]